MSTGGLPGILIQRKSFSMSKNKTISCLVAFLAVFAMTASVVVTSFTAHSAYASEVGRSTPAVGVLAGKLQNAQGDVVAFIEANETSGVEQKVAKRNQLDLQRSFLSDEQKEQQANADGRSQAQKAQQTAESLFTQLKSLDPEATKIYTTSYTISGVAVKANAAALRKLSEESDRIVHISPITEWAPLEEPKNEVTLDGDQQPQNKNSDALVGAIKAWNQTGKTGRGVNIAVVDTGLDYTHTDFGGSGNPADYATALSRTSNPLTDPALVNKLDTAKYKGGYDFAGPTYDGRANKIAQPDENPIDGRGGHHGTHVAGTVAGYGVKGDGNRFTGSYKDITAADIDDMRVGPGSAPDAGIYALKVFGDNGGSTGLVGKALDWVGDHNLNASPADQISIVSMSLGGSFGQTDSSENVQIDNLSKLGVISVIAAGNASDVTDIMGSPGTARSSLTVAASQTGKYIQDAAKVTAGPASLNGRLLAGQYSGLYRVPNFSVTAPVVRVSDPTNMEGCRPYSPTDAARVSGKIVYIKWDDDSLLCGSKIRFDNAHAAGAQGIIFGSNTNDFRYGIAGNDAIPGFQLVKNVNTDPAFQAAIDDGTLELNLARSLRSIIPTNRPNGKEDTIASFTSRGIHGSYDGTVKPDVSAPGLFVVSASAGTGSDPEVRSGTSMATPMTSGVTALVREEHPDWGAYKVKAQMINTADHDVFTDDRSIPYAPIRVGTGRIDALAAINNPVQVTADDAVTVSGQFGIVQVPKEGYSQEKQFTVSNTSNQPRTYAISYNPRTSTPGVEYKLSTNSITVAANSTASFSVTLSIPNQSALRHTRDQTQEAEFGGVHRSYVTDASGVVRLVPQGVGDSYSLRVAVSSAPKPISQTAVAYEQTVGGSTHLSISGHGIAQGSGAESYISRLVPLVLNVEDPIDHDPGSISLPDRRSLAAADIRAVGYSSTAPQLADPSQGMLSFGIVTDKTWSHLGNGKPTPVVEIDTNKDGDADYVIQADTTSVDGKQYDTVIARTYKMNADGPATVVDERPIDDDFISDANQVVLSVKLSALGFTATNSEATIGYKVSMVSTYVPGNGVVDAAGDMATTTFDAYHPNVWFGSKGASGDGTSFFDDKQDVKIQTHDSQVSPMSTSEAESLSAAKILNIHTLGMAPDHADSECQLDIVSLNLIDKVPLQTAIDESLSIDKNPYTPDSSAAFQAALEAAQRAITNPDSTQKDLDKARTDLIAARDALVKLPPVDKDKLQAAVDDAEQLNSADYTPESWKILQDVLVKAKAVLADPAVSQMDVNAQEKALRDALAQLEKSDKKNPGDNDGDGDGKPGDGKDKPGDGEGDGKSDDGKGKPEDGRGKPNDGEDQGKGAGTGKPSVPPVSGGHGSGSGSENSGRLIGEPSVHGSNELAARAPRMSELGSSGDLAATGSRADVFAVIALALTGIAMVCYLLSRSDKSIYGMHISG